MTFRVAECFKVPPPIHLEMPLAYLTNLFKKALPASHFSLLPKKALPVSHFSLLLKKRHYPPTIFHLIKKNTNRQQFFTFSQKKSIQDSHFSFFSKKKCNFFIRKKLSHIAWNVPLSFKNASTSRDRGTIHSASLMTLNSCLNFTLFVYIPVSALSADPNIFIGHKRFWIYRTFSNFYRAFVW